uniref:Uncharacterized protein n=1 Tax=Avena sativa TaxID=4498 RepID=A0ACD5Z426_AVESA
MASTRAAIFLAALICGAVAATGEVQPNGLSLGFHDNSCPILPYIVKLFVKVAFKKDAGIAPALIRILFHDCFPQGCDGSLVDDIRAAAHAACGPVVSCTDILALATRDALVEAGGPSYDLPLGRRDALAPAPLNLVITLPAPSLNATALISSFGGRGLSVTDLVALSGAHTFGISHCNSFRNRFTPETDTDPAIDPDFAAKLKAKCDGDVPAGTVNQTLDVRTPNKFDNKYYFDLVAKQGLFKSDQGLIVDSATNRTAIRFALNQKAFFDQFALSMVKMSQMDVLTGTQGEIRLSCTVPNKPAAGIETVVAATDDEDEGLATDM